MIMIFLVSQKTISHKSLFHWKWICDLETKKLTFPFVLLRKSYLLLCLSYLNGSWENPTASENSFSEKMLYNFMSVKRCYHPSKLAPSFSISFRSLTFYPGKYVIWNLFIFEENLEYLKNISASGTFCPSVFSRLHIWGISLYV
jgi:hypothetical protein